VSQGAINSHDRENLAESDLGVILFPDRLRQGTGDCCEVAHGDDRERPTPT
jgi:hypothetical protein